MESDELISFRKMITPTIIRILFWIGAGLAMLLGLVMIIGGLAARAGAGLIFMGLIYFVVGPIVIRVYCELVILMFKIYEEIVAIRKAIGGAADAAAGFPVTPVPPTPAPPAVK